MQNTSRLRAAFDRYLDVLLQYDQPGIPSEFAYMIPSRHSDDGELLSHCRRQNIPMCWREIHRAAGSLSISLQNTLAWAHGLKEDVAEHNVKEAEIHWYSSSYINCNTLLYTEKEAIETALRLFAYRERIGWLIAISIDKLFLQEELRDSLGMKLTKDERKAACNSLGIDRLGRVSFHESFKRLKKKLPDHPAVDVIKNHFKKTRNLDALVRFRNDITHNFSPAIDTSKEPFQFIEYEYAGDGTITSETMAFGGMRPVDWHIFDLIEAIEITWRDFVTGTKLLWPMPDFNLSIEPLS